jgi:hypothetical protein
VPLIILLITTGCGSSGQLQTVTVTPGTADAKNFPSGQVQFAALGKYSNSSSPVPLTSREIFWCYGGPTNVATPVAGLCAGNIAQFATVDQNGLAQCSPLFQGSVFIYAGVPGQTMPDQGTLLKLYGAAQLTCP